MVAVVTAAKMEEAEVAEGAEGVEAAPEISVERGKKEDEGE